MPERTLDRHLVGFVDALRRAGVAVPVGSTLDFGRAVAEVGADTRGGVYWSGRSTLITRPEDIATFDEVFELHWVGGVASLRDVSEPPALTVLLDDGPDAADSGEAGGAVATDLRAG